MHAKSDSEVTSLAPSSPPRSPPRRQLCYVTTPSHHDAAEKMSMGSSPPGSPDHHHHRYASSPIHHSRESSTTRFSASLKYSAAPWKKLSEAGIEEEEEEDDEAGDKKIPPKCYAVCFVLGFVLLFTLFSLILWGASKPYRPQLYIKSLVFDSFNVQAGMDSTGVATKMLSLNSTVRISFRNPATFFGVHVTSSPLELYYYQLKLASGNIREFYQSRKSQRTLVVRVGGLFVPLYGGGSGITSRADGEAPANVPLILTFVVRSKAFVLGKLVKSKFYTRVRCSFTFRETHLGKPITNLRNACQYHH